MRGGGARYGTDPRHPGLPRLGMLQGEEPQIPEVRSEDELSWSVEDDSQGHLVFGAVAVGGPPGQPGKTNNLFNSSLCNVVGNLG